jgi:hypothetical protein
MPDAALQRYKDFERTLLAELDDGDVVEAMTAAVLANKLLQYANGGLYTDDKKNWSEIHSAKLDALAEILEDNAGENVLVSYNYRFDLERLQKRFPDAVVLDKQQETIDRWNRGETRLLLAHPACLHPATEVLTEHRGWVRIIDVKTNERVFDGIEFVEHKGCSFSGIRPVIDVFGVTMTPNHRLLINNEWVSAENVRDTKHPDNEARYTYAGDDAYLRKMLPLRVNSNNQHAKCDARKSRKKRTLPGMYTGNFSSNERHPFLENMEGYDRTNNKQMFSRLQSLRGCWSKCIQGLVVVRKFLSGHVGRVFKRTYNRARRQFEGVRQRQLSLGYAFGTTIKQEKQSNFTVHGSKNTSCRILQVDGGIQRGDHRTVEFGNVSRGSFDGLRKVTVSKKPKISEVYDLVDCGPRSRFLIRNPKGEVFISHNSAGHGLNIQAGGSLIVWFGMTWSLENYLQFNARLHRQGQTKPVRIIHLVTEDTIDERVLAVLGNKEKSQSALLKALKP